MAPCPVTHAPLAAPPLAPVRAPLRGASAAPWPATYGPLAAPGQAWSRAAGQSLGSGRRDMRRAFSGRLQADRGPALRARPRAPPTPAPHAAQWRRWRGAARALAPQSAASAPRARPAPLPPAPRPAGANVRRRVAHSSSVAGRVCAACPPASPSALATRQRRRRSCGPRRRHWRWLRSPSSARARRAAPICRALAPSEARPELQGRCCTTARALLH